MTRANQQGPGDPDNRTPRDAVRDKRRAEALRVNLKRRKAQSRGRADHAPHDQPKPNGGAEPAEDER